MSSSAGLYYTHTHTCINICNFGVFSHNTGYTGATFCFDPDSLRPWFLLFFAEGVGREVPEIRPHIQLPPHAPVFPRFCPSGHVRVPPLNWPGLPRRAVPALAPPPPPHPPGEAGSQTQSRTSGTCCQRYQNKTFPKQCLTCLLVWLWGSLPLFPRAAPPRPLEGGGGIQQESGPDRKEVTHPRATALPTALHSHLLARRGPPGRGRELSQPPPVGTPKIYSPNASTPHPPILGPSQASKTKVPSDSGVLASAPSFLPSHPPGPHMGEDERV